MQHEWAALPPFQELAPACRGVALPAIRAFAMVNVDFAMAIEARAGAGLPGLLKRLAVTGGAVESLMLAGKGKASLQFAVKELLQPPFLLEGRDLRRQVVRLDTA